jgi:hypothetical protein
MQSVLESLGTGFAVYRHGFQGSSLMVPVLIENYSHCSDSVICEMELRLTPLGPPWWSVIASRSWSSCVSPLAWSSHSSELQNRRPAVLLVRGDLLGVLRMILRWQAGRVSILFNGEEKARPKIQRRRVTIIYRYKDDNLWTYDHLPSSLRPYITSFFVLLLGNWNPETRSGYNT